jgi:hypothetical protein
MHKALLLGSLILGAALNTHGANPILGEVEIEAATKLERNAGVWLDGQYVGYVKDLQGKGKLVLLPGEHDLLFKLIGYQDVARTIVVEPGGLTRYSVVLSEAPNVTYPEKAATAQLRISVQPENAAIFVNDAYVGHVDRFNGRKGMRLTPGTYRFTIALPGYQSFETELTLRASQVYEIKTELAPGTIGEQAGALTASTLSDANTR